MTVSTRLIAVGLVLFLLTCLKAEQQSGVDYESQIKPLFIEHCAACHGGLKQESSLRLDTVALMKQGGETGPAITPGKPEASFLIEVLTGDAGFTMPPEGLGTPLSAEEVQRVIRWIKAGAVGPADEKPQPDPNQWWSFQPLTKPDPPQVKDPAWVRNPIDRFIAAQHQQRGLTPLPSAPPEVLLRRVYLDLIGLPPTEQEMRAFLADPSDLAYEQTVDELLNRPEYGERWGRHWMDVWRYSDWYGRRPSNEIRYSQRHIWRWRDWIVNSLNADKGYDQMLTEMLAGDEVAPADPTVLPATGFLGRNWYKFDRNTWLFETVEQTSRGLMAVTMRCARCHDHKFDPIMQKDYYRFRAYFEPHSFRTDPVSSSGKTETDNNADKVLSEGLSRAYDNDLDAATYLFLRGDDRSPDKENPLQPGVPASLSNESPAITAVKLPAESSYAELTPIGAQVYLAAGQSAIDTAQQELQATMQLTTKLQQELAALAESPATNDTGEPGPFLQEEFDTLDPKRWKVHSGKWEIKEGKLIESQVTTFATLLSTEDHPRNFVVRARYRKLQPGSYRSVGFSFDVHDGIKNSQDVYTSKSDGKPLGGVQAFHRLAGRQIYPTAGITKGKIEVGQWVDLEFQVRESRLVIKLNGEVKLEYKLPVARKPGKFAIWVHSGSAEFERLEILPLVPNADDLKAAIATAQYDIERASKQIEVAEAQLQFRRDQIIAERARLGGGENASPLAISAHQAELFIQVKQAELNLVAAQHQLQLDESDESRAKLAAAEQSLEQAGAKHRQADGKYTQFKAKYPTTSTGRRLALAQWLTAPRNRRTSRVAVNHIWLRHFGEALVPSVDNFGLSGQPPSHPQLLDWLAVTLEDGGWNMKSLHKLMVMSSTYRLASLPPVEENANLRADPENRFLWRMNSQRMQAEVVRDSLLAIAGKLDRTMGGADIDEKKGQTTFRRSLYFRTTPDNQMTMLSLFNQASPTECYRRKDSVIPQQALALSNGRLAIDLSRQLAASITKQNGSIDESTDAEFITSAFLRVLSRRPKPAELTDCRDFLDDLATVVAQPAGLESFPASPQKTATPPSANPRQRARENLIQVLFNHNDFVTIR